MTEMTVTVDNPDVVVRKNTDGQGRLYLGKEYADTEVRVVVEKIEDTPSDDSQNADEEQEDTNPSEDSESSSWLNAGGEDND